jgi:hypothetical protein
MTLSGVSVLISALTGQGMDMLLARPLKLSLRSSFMTWPFFCPTVAAICFRFSMNEVRSTTELHQAEGINYPRPAPGSG